MNDLFSQSFLGNSLAAYCWFAGIVLTGLLFKRVISKVLSRMLFKTLKRYAAGVDAKDFVELLTKPMSIFILLITMYLAFDRLEFPSHWNLVPADKPGFRMGLFRTFQTAIVLSITWIVLRLVDFFTLVLNYKASLTESRTDDQLIPFVKESVKVAVIIISVFFILHFVYNLNITSLIAGLGIGGLAIALAAKESLENLLGSFTIFLDKPFILGDLVHVGTITGHVEKIGFRSTRLRTLEKSFVTVPNKKMVDAELDNLTLRIQRRAQFTLRLTYDTGAEQIKAILADIKQLINSHPHADAKEGRAFFSDFSTSSLDILVTYYVNTPHSDLFMEVKEEINFRIMDILQKHGCKFAYPTQSIYLHQSEIL